MSQLVVAPEADADLARILDHLEHAAGGRSATAYATRFRDMLVRLTSLPGIGAPRPRLGPLARVAFVAPYLLIYDHDAAGDRVVLLRVLHYRRHMARSQLPRRPA